MRKTLVQILEEELDECYNILTIQKIEQKIAIELGDEVAIAETGHMISAMRKRIIILERMFEEAKNPKQEAEPTDFQAIIQIRNGR